MSQATSHATAPRPERRGAPQSPRKLRPLPAAQTASRLPFLLFTALVLIAGLVGLAALRAAADEQAFAAAELESANRATTEEYSVLQGDVDRLRAPERVSEVAAERGLEPVERARIVAWPEQRTAATGAAQGTGDQNPAAASSPAAAGATTPATATGDRVWTTQDPHPIKHYLAQP